MQSLTVIDGVNIALIALVLFGIIFVIKVAADRHLDNKTSSCITYKTTEKTSSDKNSSGSTSLSGTSTKPEDPGYFAFLKAHCKSSIALCAVVFICWFIVFCNFYPGTSMNDQIIMTVDPWTSMQSQPFIYTALFASLAQGSYALFGSANFGYALYTILQMVACAGMLTLLFQWLRWHRVNRWIVIAIVAFYALLPVVQNYAICTIKDTLFSFAATLFIPLIYEYALHRKGFWNQRSHCVVLVALCTVVGLARSNGEYIILLFALVFVLFSIKRIDFKPLITSVLLIIVLVFGSTAIVHTVSHREAVFTESLSIPLQQIAAVISTNGTIPDSAIDTIEHSMNPSAVARDYTPNFADPIKLNLAQDVLDGDYIQDHKIEFLSSWFAIGMCNPETYTKAWLSDTYACWAPSAKNNVQSYFFGVSSNYIDENIQAVMDHYHIGSRSLYPESIATKFTNYHIEATRCCSGGALFLIMLWMVLFTVIRHKDIRLFWLCTPGLFLWLTLMISVPLSAALRYSFMILLALPVLLGILFIPRIRGRNASSQM
jgi:hypothetical protein